MQPSVQSANTSVAAFSAEFTTSSNLRSLVPGAWSLACHPTDQVAALVHQYAAQIAGLQWKAYLAEVSPSDADTCWGLKLRASFCPSAICARVNQSSNSGTSFFAALSPCPAASNFHL